MYNIKYEQISLKYFLYLLIDIISLLLLLLLF